MDSPRFPQPAIEALLEYAGWRDVLNALSVDRREAPARHWLINATGMFMYNDTMGRPSRRCTDFRVYMRLIAKYPHSVRALLRSKWTSWTPPALQRMECVGDLLGQCDLPATLTHLSISVGSGPLPDGFALPPKLSHLTLRQWNAAIIPSLLRSSITHLEIDMFRNNFPQGQCLPKTLKHLTIISNIYRAGFLQGVQWPEGLQSLCLPHTTHQSLHGVAWPTTLTNLHIGGVYDVHLPEGSLPPALTHLTVALEEIQVLDSIEWPKTITHLRAMETDWRNNLPPTLQVLVITSNSYRREETTRGLDRVVWPATLRRLTIPHRLLAGTPRPPKGCTVVVDRQPELSW